MKTWIWIVIVVAVGALAFWAGDAKLFASTIPAAK